MNKETDFSLNADPELSGLLTQPPMITDNDRGRADPVRQQLVRQETQVQGQQPVQFKPVQIKWGPGCGLQCKDIKHPPPPPPPPSVQGGKRKKRGMKRTSKNSKKYKNKNHKRHQTKRVIKKRNKLNNS